MGFKKSKCLGKLVKYSEATLLEESEIDIFRGTFRIETQDFKFKLLYYRI